MKCSIDNGISDHGGLLQALSKVRNNGYHCTNTPLNIEYFCELWVKEIWEDLNTLAFPRKVMKPIKDNYNKWITQCVRISSQKQKNCINCH